MESFTSFAIGAIFVLVLQSQVQGGGYYGDWRERELQNVQSRVTAFQEAYRRRNPEELYRNFFREDSVLLPNNGPIYRGRGIITNYQNAFRNGVSHLTREPVKRQDVTVLTRKLIVEITAYRLYHVNGNLMDTGKSLIVWKKNRNTWYMYNTMWNRNSAS